MDTSAFNVLSLCSGVGGLELGLKLAVPTARTVCFVEREAFCCEILAERMEDGCLDESPIWTDLRTFDGKPWRGIVDCVTGGYPCQPFSIVGKQQGTRDERWLWPHIARIIREVEPGWCFFENVGNHLRVGFQQVEDELRQMGYVVASGLFSASEVGATHRRERLFILANTNDERCRHSALETDHEGGQSTSVRSSHVSNRQGWHSCQPNTKSWFAGIPVVFPPHPDDWEGWNRVLDTSSAEPVVRGVVDGVSSWLDRLRACGNGVVPAVAALAWKTLVGVLKPRRSS